MLKNLLKGVLFIIFFSFFFLLAQKNTVKAACSPEGSFCGYYCNYNCPGYCNYAVYKRECWSTDPDCCKTNTCQYGEVCHCEPVVSYFLCVWDSTCIQTKCSAPACTDWGPWGPCTSTNYKYRYCRTVGNDAYEKQQASFGIVRIDLL